MKILGTGGCGYIGSHTLVELIQSGHSVIVVDNLSNSSKEALERVEKITGQKIPLHVIDCADKAALAMVFDQNQIDAAIHFAGLKSVGESVSKPLAYYRNNIGSTLSLCQVMQDTGSKRFIFSSSPTFSAPPHELTLPQPL